MEYILYILFALVVYFLVQNTLPAKGIKQISTAELKHILKDKNKQFIDVRTRGEFGGNHIKGFTNIPLQELSSKASSKLVKEKEVLVICQSGMRSSKASRILKKQGFLHITNIKGGMSAWRG